MAKTIKAGRMLDPVQVGEIPMERRTKGTQYSNGGTGFNLKFNLMPPGLDLVDENSEPDDVRIAGIKPIGPILK